MNATVYSKPACTQCNATYRALDKKGFPYRSIDVSKDEAAREHSMSFGYMQAPVVVVEKDGEVIDHWSGFNPEKIAEHASALQEAQTI